jgi:hypothetical protein
VNKTEARKKTKELTELLSRLGDEIARLNERERKLHDKVEAAKKELQEVCLHDKIEQKHYYFDGSYYDRAYTDRWNQCCTCGAKSEVTTEYHSWYG